MTPHGGTPDSCRLSRRLDTNESPARLSVVMAVNAAKVRAAFDVEPPDLQAGELVDLLDGGACLPARCGRVHVEPLESCSARVTVTS